ncbi:hypothetical protein GCM10010404_54920 [Nonomuraea africana]|uniref:EmrB/QacA subfamily drug resistance transporter n=1 Tax=Nonomuraea africana TaxID=46171 RepID=A0ABR9K5Y2_9ACTN|nr:MFS transporter [Nonomuraea africana]MBE1557419.1 EmrB/QacA subfamily drug resistance transporter [Nonomuraea africana]
MLMLDLTVINVALPDLGADLGLSRGAFTWVVSVYVLFLGGLLLLGGRLADVFGARSMILTGLVVFILASLASGLAQDEALLIGGRLCQGVGAAVLSPAALRALTGIFHSTERNKALGVWSSLWGIGFAVGVFAGGLLTSGPGWRWVFFINIPIGVVALVAIRALVPERRTEDANRRIDVLGAVIVTAATGSFIYGMINAGDHGWADPGTLVSIAAAVVLYVVFTVVERKVQNPLMRPDMLVRRPVATGAFLMLIAAGVTVADLFITSQYLQHLRGYSALETGLFFLPTALSTMVGAIVGGRLVGTIGTRPVGVAGLALVAIGNGLLIGLSAKRQRLRPSPSRRRFVRAGWRPGVRRRDHCCPRPSHSERGRVGIGYGQPVPPSLSRWAPLLPLRVSPAHPRSRGSPTSTPCSPSSPPWPRRSRWSLHRPESHR